VAGSAMVAAEQTESDAAVGQLRASVDWTALDSAWAEGGRLTPDDAVALALGS
jgi:hypothetical protein